MTDSSTVGSEFAKAEVPQVLMGQLSPESLEAIRAVLGPGATDVGGYFVMYGPEDAPVHIYHFHYTDSSGHHHEGIGAEYPDNGHSVVLADVVVN